MQQTAQEERCEIWRGEDSVAAADVAGAKLHAETYVGMGIRRFLTEKNTFMSEFASGANVAFLRERFERLKNVFSGVAEHLESVWC